jgi:ribosome-binding factor A
VGHRLLKVNEAIKEALSTTIGAGLKDPRVGFVTVTGVETSPDLRHARVFVTVLGDSSQREATLEGLRASHGFLQSRVSREVRLKRTPQLTFIYDETTDRAQRIEDLLRRYENERVTDTPGHESDGGGADEASTAADAAEAAPVPDPGEASS